MDLLNAESVMATRIEYRVKKAVGSTYPNLNFTTETSSNPSQFPSVYIHKEIGSELGMELNSKSINALDMAFQIVIKTNTNKSDCINIRNACVEAVKKDGFRVIINDAQLINNVYQSIIHFYGVRAVGDKLK